MINSSRQAQGGIPADWQEIRHDIKIHAQFPENRETMLQITKSMRILVEGGPNCQIDIQKMAFEE